MITSSYGETRALPGMSRLAAPRTGSTILLDDPTRELCADITSGQLTPARLAVIAPGGYGKTALLNHLAEGCAHSGIPIARFGDHNCADLVLVDDAHQLSGSALTELQRLAHDERTGLVLTARPWPRYPALTQVLARLHGQIVLRPLNRSRISTLLGDAPRDLVDFIASQTGGVPGLVVRLSNALGADPQVPNSVLVDLGSEIDRLAPDTLLLLLAILSGAGLDPDLLGPLLDRDQHAVAEVIDAARATGMLGQDGMLLPLAARALEARIPADRRVTVAQQLVRLQLERQGPVLGLIQPLLDSGISGTEPASIFEKAAEEATLSDPALATRLFSAAAAAGRPVTVMGARWAETTARTGKLCEALRLADQVIADPEAMGRAHSAQTAGTVLMHRGQPARSYELYRWSGTQLSTVYSTIALLGTGQQAEAERILATLHSDETGCGEPPTLLSGAMTALARGVLESVTCTPTVPLSTLSSAAEILEPVVRSTLLPDSPAALGALVGMQCGELGIAQALLQRALTEESGGPPLAARHQLLLAWIAMMQGDTELATERLAAVETEPAPRDWLFAVGLRVGLARRTGDLTGLRMVWDEACQAIIRYRIDLFTLLPFGEFVIAAARLGERDRLTHHLQLAQELLHNLNTPALWSTPLHWSGLHAAIMTEQRQEAEEHVRALTGIAEHSRYHTVIATAAECWLDVLAGVRDPARVAAAAQELHDVGLRWDGARLAGQAAIRTSDRTAMVTLLERARMLQGTTATTSTATTGKPGLSERELQVAELVVAGRTYKQVGDQLFISAKTVEHHMARMRQRLGATSRDDLLTQLRALIADRNG